MVLAKQESAKSGFEDQQADNRDTTDIAEKVTLAAGQRAKGPFHADPANRERRTLLHVHTFRSVLSRSAATNGSALLRGAATPF